MAKLSFHDFSFRQSDKGDIRADFLKIFCFDLKKDELEGIASFKIDRNSIEFEGLSEDRARRKFNLLLERAFPHLRNRLNKKPAIYIHKNSGIPLIGTNYFGLIDRGSNLIEIKPITSCNISCIYCSVDEGPRSRRKTDYVVEKDYILEEFKKLIEYKEADDIDAHINSQGEPTLYADLVELVEGISEFPQVKVISIDTNGTLLTKEFIDQLAQAGLTRINLSLNALDPKIADKMAGFPYNLKKVLEMAEYIPKTPIDLLIAPVWLPGVNDEELPKLAKFALKVGAGKRCPPIGIQNYLPYKFGRNPVKSASLESFFRKLRELEKEHGVKLIYDRMDFQIRPVKELPKPFRKGQAAEAELLFPGRLAGEMLAKAGGRIIAIPGCHKHEGRVKVRMTRTKHNIFIGKLA